MDSSIKTQLPLVNYDSPVSDEKEKPDILKQCAAIHSLSDCSLSRHESMSKSADVIKDFFRKSIAAQSYGKMFSTGTRFKELGIDLPPLEKEKFSFASLQHFDKISDSYLNEIKGKTQNLTPQEKKLVNKIVSAKLHFRHQSNVQLVTSNDSLNILSMSNLNFQGAITGKNTNSGDMKYLANHDFVFFGVEFSDDKSQLPLNTRHGHKDFGAYAYITDSQFPYGYFTLTDHLFNRIEGDYIGDFGLENFASQFPEMPSERARAIHGDKGINDVPIYNVKDMKVALGLHLVDFLRKSNDAGFKAFALDENLDSKQLDGILNYIFTPEFHVPRIMSTTNFTKIKLREVTIEEAVKAHSLEELSPYIQNKDDACTVMTHVIEKSKHDIVEYLFSKFDFTKEDIIKMKKDSFRSMGYDLVHRADEKILTMFLERGLVNPNEPTRLGYPEMMLDHVMPGKDKIRDILLSFGAVSGLQR